MASLSIKIADREVEAIRKAVEEGYAMNVSDFVKQAVRDRLSDIKA